MKFTKKIYSILLLLLFVVAQINAQNTELTKEIPFDPNVKTGKLANGLSYYIRKNAKPEKRVELRLVVNAGSVLEDDDQLGLAHFTEHMCFNGTKRFPKNELVSYLQSIGVQFGADLNAYTGFDETVYILPVPTDKPELVEKGLQILEDWAHQVSFEGSEIDKERGVVIEEWRLGQGAFRRMLDKTLPITYKNSRYAERLPIGKKEILENFRYPVIKRFYKDWYRPDLMAVIAVGDIEVADMENKIKQYFSGIAPTKNRRERKNYEVPDHQEIYIASAKDKEAPFTQVQVIYKKATEDVKTLQDYAKTIHYSLFTGMLNQRLNELRLSADPPFIGASAYYGGTWARTKDAYQTYATVSETGIEKGLKAILEENKRIKKFGFTEAEFERYKKQMLNNYEKSFNERTKTESANYVEEYISHFLQQEPSPGIEFEYNFVKAYLPQIKLTDINALAEKWVSNDNMVVIINSPDKEGVKIPWDEEIKKIIKEVNFNAVKPYEEKTVASAFIADAEKAKIKAGKVVKESKNAKLNTIELTLANGLKVILKPTDFKNDEILMSSFSPGGNSVVADADFYSASNAAGIIQESGVKDIPTADIQKMLAGKTVRVNPGIGQLTEAVNGSAAPKDLETMLQLVHLYFTAPRKDENAFKSYINKNKSLYQNLMSNPQFYFSSEVSKILSQNHPRGGGFPKPEDLEKVNFEKAFEIYTDRFADAGDFTFLFVGNIEIDKITPLLEMYLGSLPAKGRKETWKDLGVRPPKGKVEKVINKGTDPKSQVLLYFAGEAAYSAKDNFLLNSLGQLLDIKLIEKLREEKGGVYGAGAYGNFSKYPYENYSFTISFPCAPENVQSLIKDALEEIKKVQKEGVKAEDLAKIKEQQKRELEVNLKQNRFWLNNLQQAYFLGNNPEEILNSEKTIENLNSEDLKAVANKYVKTDSFIRIVLMPEKEGKSGE